MVYVRLGLLLQTRNLGPVRLKISVIFKGDEFREISPQQPHIDTNTHKLT